MSAALPTLGELAMRAEGGERAQPVLDDGSSVLFLIADQIDATPESEADSYFHMWASAVRFVARTLAYEADEVQKWLRSGEKPANDPEARP